eukprot:TRINITY_DN6519_c0_g1_i1.p1 TRINITY_DN6519_c0_g1~~TRINITY_DN6519_c0_g1_i1.p1  ORF type:complete len:513 (+),score=162.23 TRINITY_DN6519_c0_g1_i1:120-1541(+)
MEEKSLESLKDDKKKPKYAFQKKKTGVPSSSPSNEPPKNTVSQALTIEPCLSFEMLDDVAESLSHQNRVKTVASVHSNEMVDTRIVSVRKMTAENSEKQVMELRLKPLSPFHFEPGDSIGIIPCNVENEVSELCKLLGLSLHSRFRLKKLKEKKLDLYLRFLLERESLEVGDVFRTWLDIRSTPKKSLLRVLSQNCEDEAEKKELQDLCESIRYFNEIIQPGTTLSDLLKRFPSSKPTLSNVIEELPALTPRYYSLSSSPSSPYLSIIYTVILQPKPGLCSSFLSNLCTEFQDNQEGQDTILPVFLRSSPSFKLPKDTESNIIMIGAGTGVAPFMSFIQHRAESLSNSTEVPHSWLFFGCRREEEDFLYGDELVELAKKGSLSRLIPAFSRKESGSKTYVQHKLMEHKEEIWNIFFQDNAHLFICGDGFGMTKGVMEALAKILAEKSDVSYEEATEKVKELKKNGKISTDVWG